MASGDCDLKRKRREAEISFAGGIFHTALGVGSNFTAVATAGSSSGNQTPNPTSMNAPSPKVDVLTPSEQRIFGARTYFNYAAGLAAGAATFVVVFGGLRWHASRTILAARQKLSNVGFKQIQSQHVAELDGGTARNMRRNAQFTSRSRADSSPASTSGASSNSIISDDVIAHIQFMCVGALSIVVTSTVARLLYNRQEFLKDLGDWPLQPGQSRLVHAVCPTVLKQYERTIQNETKKEFIVSDMEDKLDISDPLTVELESMIHLVNNCRLRMDYERDHGGTSEVPCNVPEPGVPLRYANRSRPKSVGSRWL